MRACKYSVYEKNILTEKFEWVEGKEGFFHGFFMYSHGSPEGFNTFPMVLVETFEGCMAEVSIDKIRFSPINRPE